MLDTTSTAMPTEMPTVLSERDATPREAPPRAQRISPWRTTSTRPAISTRATIIRARP